MSGSTNNVGGEAMGYSFFFSFLEYIGDLHIIILRERMGYSFLHGLCDVMTVMNDSLLLLLFSVDILYDSWSPAMTVSSVCISILSMLSSSPAKQRPQDNDRYVRNCRNGRSPKETRWWFHDDKV
uniref:Ubiquitin-conjugating enzyme E2 W n=1 Tax=Arundo donax TaxID=35708 RepID=A0A0A9HBU1_ARUDO